MTDHDVHYLRNREAALLALGLTADQLSSMAAGIADPKWQKVAQRCLLAAAAEYQEMENERAAVRDECAGRTWEEIRGRLRRWLRRAQWGSILETVREQEYRRIVALRRAQGGEWYDPLRDPGHRVVGG